MTPFLQPSSRRATRAAVRPSRPKRRRKMGDITDEELNDPGRTRSAFGCSEGKNHILDEEAGCELCRTRRERDEAVELLVVIVDRLCHNEVNGYLDTRGSAI